MTRFYTCEPVPVTIRGKYFRTISAAAAHFGLSPSAVSIALETGRLDYVGTGRNKAMPVTIGPVTYPSMSKAERATGISRGRICTYLKSNGLNDPGQLFHTGPLAIPLPAQGVTHQVAADALVCVAVEHPILKAVA